MPRYNIDVRMFGSAWVTAPTEEEAMKKLAERLDNIGTIAIFSGKEPGHIDLNLSVDAEGDYTMAMDIMEEEDEQHTS